MKGAILTGGWRLLEFVLLHDFRRLRFQFREEGAFADAEGFEFLPDGGFAFRFDEDLMILSSFSMRCLAR